MENIKFTKVVQCTTMKELLKNIKSIYEGYDKVEKDKLKTLSAQFERLHMKEEEHY